MKKTYCVIELPDGKFIGCAPDTSNAVRVSGVSQAIQFKDQRGALLAGRVMAIRQFNVYEVSETDNHYAMALRVRHV